MWDKSKNTFNVDTFYKNRLNLIDCIGENGLENYNKVLWKLVIPVTAFDVWTIKYVPYPCLEFWFCFFPYSHNTEKVIYFLLLERKKRRPANEDETVVVKNIKNTFDPPKKRVDTCKMIDDIDSNFSQISAGSPATPRKQMLQWVRKITIVVSGQPIVEKRAFSVLTSQVKTQNGIVKLHFLPNLLKGQIAHGLKKNKWSNCLLRSVLKQVVYQTQNF